MDLSRRAFGGLALSGLALPRTALAQEISMLDAMRAPLSAPTSEFNAAMEMLRTRGNPDVAASLINALRFSRSRGPQIAETLQAVTGEDYFTDWFAWML